jgi:Holliday junction resolvase-like predicted endonuclease
MTDNVVTGTLGEPLAVDLLMSLGCRYGELDVIAAESGGVATALDERGRTERNLIEVSACWAPYVRRSSSVTTPLRVGTL